MDNQDHRKNHPSGHEGHGVHLCHKCGWPFPNSHPSAKHRRAHKKVCGKIEGYKLTESEENSLVVSDEEQLLDEDHKGPGSSKLEESRNNESVKSGIQGEESIRSEGEEFSDAVAEFRDVGINPTIEIAVAMNARDPDVNMVADVRDLTSYVKATAGENIVQAPEFSTCGRQSQNLQALESSAGNFEGNLQFQDHASSSTISSLVASVSDKGTESVTVEMTEDGCGSACFVSPGKSETLENVLSENTDNHTGENVVDSSMTYIGQDKDAQENGKCNIDGNFPPMAVQPASLASEIDFKLQEVNGLVGAITNDNTSITKDIFPMNRHVDSREEKTDAGGLKKTQTDPCPSSCSGSMKVEVVEHVGAFVHSAQAAVDSAQEVDNEYLGETVDGCHVKAEVNESITAFSTPTDIPAEGHSEMTSRDCKDHGTVTSDIYLTPGCGEVIKEMDEHSKNPASEETHSLSCKSDEGADVSSAKQVVEGNLQKEGTGSNSMVEAVCIKCKIDTTESTASAGDGSGGLEALPVPDPVSSDLTLIHTEKSQMVCSIEKQDTHESHPQKILPENLTVAGGDVMVSLVDSEFHKANNAVIAGDDVCEKARIEDSDIAGNYGGKGAIEEISIKSKYIAPDFETDLSKTELNIHAYRGIGESEKNSQEPGSTHLDTVVDSSGMSINQNHMQNVTELCSNLQGFQNENFQEGSKEPEVKSTVDSSVKKSEIQAECVGADSGVSEPLHEENRIDSSSVRKREIQAECISTYSRVSEPLHEESSDDSSSVRKREIQAECVGTGSRVSEPLHEETKVDHNIVESLQNSVENLMLNEHMSSMDTEFFVLSSVTVADNSTKDLGGDASDINSQSLQNDDGMVPSMRDATDEPVNLAAETLPATNTQTLEKEDSTAKDFHGDASKTSSQSLQDEGDKNLLKQRPGGSAVVPVYNSVNTSSQTDSVEVYWGSVSDGALPSTRDAIDEPAILATEALPTSGTQGAKDDAQNDLKNKVGAFEEHRSDNSDIFEPPSFMTLVEPGGGIDQHTSSSEINTVQNPQQLNSSSLQAGWFPSLTHVVKESQGRKRNEEVIAKVCNWSSGKPTAPLRSLLVEANLESKQKGQNAQGQPTPATHKEESSAQDNSLPAKTLPPLTAPEESAAHAAKGGSEKEWNSSARLLDGKTEKKKVKGKPYWVSFVCCSSVNLDP